MHDTLAGARNTIRIAVLGSSLYPLAGL
eukprot:SAG11_NODE_25026_length_364_cov_1.532075_2_plen_27_part_01